MIKFVDILEYYYYVFSCEYCGTEIKARVSKYKLPAETMHQGIYTYKGEAICPNNECDSTNNFNFRVFYNIRNKKDKGKYQAKKEKNIRSYKHRCDAFCRMCNSFESVDCENVSCPLYGVRKVHRQKRIDSDFWWAADLSFLKKSHDRFYNNKCDKMTNEESKDYFSTQTTEKSSQNSK